MHEAKHANLCVCEDYNPLNFKVNGFIRAARLGSYSEQTASDSDESSESEDDDREDDAGLNTFGGPNRISTFGDLNNDQQVYAFNLSLSFSLVCSFF